MYIHHWGLVVMKGVCGWITGKTGGKGEKLKMQKL